VPVVKLGEGVRVVQAQQSGVRLLAPRTHNLYMTARPEMCHVGRKVATTLGWCRRASIR
jgi:hypothetical protein